ncbi:hypothetical protein M3Y99_01738400 [Aphelenchoides fujianensis]|nr:hypothetical protein M3Y99_01738400 [Aphelenchoides fujianensis]
MREQCPVTCGYCQQYDPQPITVAPITLAPFYPGQGVSCCDSSTSCYWWAANGFCTSTFYTYEQKLQYCRATCGLCRLYRQLSDGFGFFVLLDSFVYTCT